MDDSTLWYKNALFYEVYIRAFYDSNGDGHGDLRGLIRKLDYLQELGVDCLWLSPIYPSPLRDDGYDISDYRSILPEYGSMDDFKALLDASHARGMRLITDLVLNHTSEQHAWFQASRSNPASPYRDYYVWSETDQKYLDARIIFLDSEDSNWEWDESARLYYWHRFYVSQPDLNFDNPRVQQEMLDVVRYWLDLGVDGFRVDAVPYLYEREGTNCENLPETHAYLKRLRSFVDENYPGRLLLCEANQWPEDVRTYFGDGDEFHMGFHFPIMPRIFMSLRKEDASALVQIMDSTPVIPENCQWGTFLRNHDELTLEMVTEDERQWMWQEFAPEPRMRLNLGIRRRLAPLLDNDRRKIELANSLLLTLPGSPILYYGDEIGMGDNIWLPDRNGVRTPMQWNNGTNAGFSSADPEMLYAPIINASPFDVEQVNVEDQINDPGSLWYTLRHMISIRKANPVFGEGEFLWANSDVKSVAAYWRSLGEERVLIVNNLSHKCREILISLPTTGKSKPIDMLDGKRYPVISNGELKLTLCAYQYLWLKV